MWTGYGTTTSSCEHGDEPLGSIKVRNLRFRGAYCLRNQSDRPDGCIRHYIPESFHLRVIFK
jgi:hypothetical protein